MTKCFRSEKWILFTVLTKLLARRKGPLTNENITLKGILNVTKDKLSQILVWKVLYTSVKVSDAQCSNNYTQPSLYRKPNVFSMQPTYSTGNRARLWMHFCLNPNYFLGTSMQDWRCHNYYRQLCRCEDAIIIIADIYARMKMWL